MVNPLLFLNNAHSFGQNLHIHPMAIQLFFCGTNHPFCDAEESSVMRYSKDWSGIVVFLNNVFLNSEFRLVVIYSEWRIGKTDGWIYDTIREG